MATKTPPAPYKTPKEQVPYSGNPQGLSLVDNAPMPNSPSFGNPQGSSYFPSTSSSNAPIPNSTGQLGYQDPMAALQQLYGQATPNFGGDAASQAAGIYSPAHQDLTRQEGLATSNSKYNDAQIAAMYRALQGSIGGDAQKIAGVTNQQLGANRQATQQATGAIGQAYQGANSEVAGLMKQLGIEQAAGGVLPQGAEHQALLQGLSQYSGQNSDSLARQLGANAQDFNTAQGNIAGFEGNQQRVANQQNLSNKLSTIGTNRANIDVQQGQTALGIQNNLQSMYLNSLNAKAGALSNMYTQQQQMQIAQMNNQQAMMQLQLSRTPTQYQNYQMTPNSEKLYGQAGNYFGPSGASKAMTLINSLGGTQAATPEDFAHIVAQAAQQSNDPEIKALSADKLQSLAMQVALSNKNNPNPINYLSPTG